MIKNEERPEQELDPMAIASTPEDFIAYYNDNIPDAFPHATLNSLKVFQARFPSLFKKEGEWIINKHRKKYMDWLSSYREA